MILPSTATDKKKSKIQRAIQEKYKQGQEKLVLSSFMKVFSFFRGGLGSGTDLQGLVEVEVSLSRQESLELEWCEIDDFSGKSATDLQWPNLEYFSIGIKYLNLAFNKISSSWIQQLLTHQLPKLRELDLCKLI